MLLHLLLIITIIPLAYFAGSLCSAIIICKLFNLPDPRSEGSKNPGATNVFRIAGKKYAFIVLVGDMLKGLIPMLLAHLLAANTFTLSMVALAAVLGHIYPIFFNYQGGKGVATALGAFLGFHFIMGVVAIASWILVANFSRYSSFASLITMVLLPFYSLPAAGNFHAFIPFLIITICIIYQHRVNISRLINGDEPKIQGIFKKVK